MSIGGSHVPICPLEWRNAKKTWTNGDKWGQMGTNEGQMETNGDRWGQMGTNKYKILMQNRKRDPIFRYLYTPYTSILPTVLQVPSEPANLWCKWKKLREKGKEGEKGKEKERSRDLGQCFVSVHIQRNDISFFSSKV